MCRSLFQPPSKLLSSILGKSNLQFAGMSINLNISTSSLNLMTPDSKQVQKHTLTVSSLCLEMKCFTADEWRSFLFPQIIANHHMQSISFASGGDPVRLHNITPVIHSSADAQPHDTLWQISEGSGKRMKVFRGTSNKMSVSLIKRAIIYDSVIFFFP